MDKVIKRLFKCYARRIFETVTVNVLVISDHVSRVQVCNSIRIQ